MKVTEAAAEAAEAQAAYESCTPEEQLAIWEAYYSSQNPAADSLQGKADCLFIEPPPLC